MRLSVVALLSTAVLFTMSQSLQAHELRPTVADIEVTQNEVRLTLFLTLEPMIAGIDLEGLTDTNMSPLSADNDQLRALSPEQLKLEFHKAWPKIKGSIHLKAGDVSLTPKIIGLEIAEIGNVELPRDSVLSLIMPLPADNSAVSLSWGKGLGLLALRQVGEAATYEAMLSGGDESAALPRSGSVEVRFTKFLTQYIKIGFEHIVPKGLDHILFVLGLFFFAAAFRPLLWQITTFTLAHTITLALATLGVISLSAAIVEPLIAASIIYIAFENIFSGKLTKRRLFVIFAFGLLHGLGFASVLGEVGLQPARFISGLVGFNIGVEIGQIAVVLTAFLLVGMWFRNKEWYGKFVRLPASIAIAGVGAYWFVERVFL